MQFEETVDTSETVVSSKSRTDYCCWRLYKTVRGGDKEICVTVLETKHIPTKGIDLKGVSQVLGYYCCKREASNVAGVCLLLIEMLLLPFSLFLERCFWSSVTDASINQIYTKLYLG